MTFFSKDEVLAFHHLNIERFGGSHGLLNDGAFESALMAAENRYFYEDADAIACAAAYGFHLCQAHAFVDGNKRIGAILCELFLRESGFRLEITNDEIIETFLDIASGKMNRDQLEAFLRSRAQKLP